MLTQDVQAPRWEFRPAFRGDTVSWAREPSGAVAGDDAAWRAESPPIPDLITSVARVLRLAEGEDRPLSLVTAEGERWRLQRGARSRSAGIRGAVVTLQPEAAVDALVPRPGRPVDTAAHAALCAWVLGVAPRGPEPTAPLAEPAEGGPPGVDVALTVAAWHALISDAPLAQVVRADWSLPEPCAFVDGPAGVLKGLRRHGLPLLSVVQGEVEGEAPAALGDWIASNDVVWDQVRGLIPPRPAVGAYLQGRLRQGALGAAVRSAQWLRTHAESLPLATLRDVADALEGAQIAHRLREGRWFAVAERRDLVVAVGNEGLDWVSSPPASWSVSDLVTWTSGPFAAWAPAALRHEAEAALTERAANPGRAGTWLAWHLLGMPVAAAKLEQPARLTPVLDWAETQGPQAAGSWSAELLALAERTARGLGMLSLRDGRRVARLLRVQGAATADLRARCLGLVVPEDRAVLLSELGLSLRSAQPPRRWLRHERAPVVRPLRPQRTGRTSAEGQRTQGAAHTRASDRSHPNKRADQSGAGGVS